MLISVTLIIYPDYTDMEYHFNYECGVMMVNKKRVLIAICILIIVFISGCISEKLSENDFKAKPTPIIESKTNNENNTTDIGKKNDNSDTIKQNKQTVNEKSDKAKEKEIKIPYKKGDNGDEIKEVQHMLNKFGYRIVEDGIFGNNTYFAVLDFQRRNKITVNGLVDMLTISYLKKQPTEETMYKPPITNTNTSSNTTVTSYINSKNIESATGYFIWIDSKNQRVNIYNGYNHNWSLIKSMICSSGKPSTPTIKGMFTVGTKGSYFIADSGARCKYYTQISGNYLFHSILYDNSGSSIIDGRLGMPLSHGCVRLSLENAKYIYYNIPTGTTVWSN